MNKYLSFNFVYNRLKKLIHILHLSFFWSIFEYFNVKLFKKKILVYELIILRKIHKIK